MRSFLLAALAVAALSACTREPPPAAVPAAAVSPDARVERLADREFDLWLQLYVDDRARAGLPTGAPDVSAAGLKKMASDAGAILNELRTIPAAELGEDARLTHALIQEAAEIEVAAASFYDIHFAVAPNQASFHFLAYVDELHRQPGADAAGRAGWLERVGYYGELARQHRQRLEEQQARGSRMSKYLVDRTVRMFASLRKTLRADVSIERIVSETPPPDRDAFKKEAEAAVGNADAAFDALITFLQGDYRAQAPDKIGLSQYPRGVDYYRYLIRRNSSLQLDPQAIHDLGRKRVAELEQDILTRAAKLGYRIRTLRGFFDLLKADPRFTAKSVDDWQREYTADLSAIQAHLPRAFERLPAAGYRLQPMRESEQGLAYGYYAAPTPTQKEGIFFFSGSDPSGPSLLGTRALAYHEVVPGHHLQLARVVETKSLHKLRSIYWVGGYLEGWAEYGVSLADELGSYSEPHEQIGHRIWELLMSGRLVADTGINALGWSLDDAQKFWQENSNLTPPEIDSEIQRSAAIPGQLLVYRLGFEKMRELRQRTQSALGDRFDLKAYHEMILKDGALPLPVLEQKVERYIATYSGPAKHDTAH